MQVLQIGREQCLQGWVGFADLDVDVVVEDEVDLGSLWEGKEQVNGERDLRVDHWRVWWWPMWRFWEAGSELGGLMVDLGWLPNGWVGGVSGKAWVWKRRAFEERDREIRSPAGR